MAAGDRGRIVVRDRCEMPGLVTVQSMSLNNDSSDTKLFVLRKGQWWRNMGENSHPLGFDDGVDHTINCSSALGKLSR